MNDIVANKGPNNTQQIAKVNTPLKPFCFDDENRSAAPIVIMTITTKPINREEVIKIIFSTTILLIRLDISCFDLMNLHLSRDFLCII